MSGTPEQRLALAEVAFETNYGLSSGALLKTLIRGSDVLEQDEFGGDGRPRDWSDVGRNLSTFERLPEWAKPQAREIIIESLRIVNERYPSDEAFVNAVGRLSA